MTTQTYIPTRSAHPAVLVHRPGLCAGRLHPLYGATAGIGASLGLVIGGALASWVSWPAGFFINVPIPVGR